MTGGCENIRGVLMMRGGGGGGSTNSSLIMDSFIERSSSSSAGGNNTELLNIGGSGGSNNSGNSSSSSALHLLNRHGVVHSHLQQRGGDKQVLEDPICSTCQEKIVQRYLLQVNGLNYHTDCLRCFVCNVCLQTESSCFIRDARIYCKGDYYRTYGSAQCAKCTRWISSSDWVRRARDSQAEQIYHLACFACDACHRQLSTGEEFALVEKKLLCKTHYQETVDSGEDSCGEGREEEEGGSSGGDGGGGRNSSSGGGGRSGGSKSKTKRVRTTFTDEQLQILQANFQIDSNPDGQDLERIAQITGLSKRVTQVWFQNSRARQKKHHVSGGSGGGGGSGKSPLNNNMMPMVLQQGGSSASSLSSTTTTTTSTTTTTASSIAQSASPTQLHHHHHHMHGHHVQQISRVLTRDNSNNHLLNHHHHHLHNHHHHLISNRGGSGDDGRGGGQPE